ncbi:hypothetical protein KSF78_0001783 [Schistosoma japonicum]|nr:hypothetical protein KSF78_0001783 [Schistosoma japonicum]
MGKFHNNVQIIMLFGFYLHFFPNLIIHISEEIVDYTRIRKDDCPKGAPFCDENGEDELRIKKEKENEEKKKGKKKTAIIKGKQPINGNLCNPQC